jgi:GAF domain-containing protein
MVSTPNSPRMARRAGPARAHKFALDHGTRVQRLGEVVSELAAVQEMGELVEAIVGHSADAIGARVASLSVLDAETEMLTLVAIAGARDGAGQRWATYPVASATPAAEALRERRMIAASGRDAIEARYPELVGEVVGDGSLLCLPLIAGNRSVGVISLSTADRWAPDPGEVEVLAVFADTCAQALERVQARAEADDRARQLTFLAAASAELASSLDYHATLATVARLAVPTIADWCAVEILDDGRLRTLAVEHIDPAKVALAEELQQRYPTDFDAPTGSPNVVRTGRSELHRVITDEMLVAATRDEEHLRLARDLHLHSALIVPLLARGRALGAITLVLAESDRTYRQDDIPFAEDLGRRAAIAIDNAQLHSQTRDAALQLQRAVLPDDLSGVAGWEIATFYSPAGRTDVGGDFYDAIPIADGRIVVVTGDVMGRGVAAAAAMARMRSAVHAYLALDPDPVVVMTNLDRMFAKFNYARLVSMVYVLIEAGAEQLSIVNAGHCAPLVVGPDGAVDFLNDAPSPLLGVATTPRTSTRHRMLAGSALLTYTDGLIERRDEDLESGFARLAAAAGCLAGGTLTERLPVLVDRVRDSRRDDDVTAFAIRQQVQPVG